MSQKKSIHEQKLLQNSKKKNENSEVGKFSHQNENFTGESQGKQTSS